MRAFRQDEGFTRHTWLRWLWAGTRTAVLVVLPFAKVFAHGPLRRRTGGAQILTSDPQVAAEFRHKLDTDETFGRDPQARLDFFYCRSASWDERLNLYPVYRVEQALPRGVPN